MTNIEIGCRFWKAGDRAHIWVVDGLIPAKAGVPAYAILVSDDERQVEEVDLSHLEDPEQFTRIA